MGRIFTDKPSHPRKSAVSVFSVVSYLSLEGTILLLLYLLSSPIPGAFYTDRTTFQKWKEKA
jgi:hypothetical protein